MNPDLAVVVQAIETSLEIRFDHQEISDETTVKELLAAIERKDITTPHHDVCLTATMFWRMRQAARLITHDQRIRPTSVVQIRNRRTWRMFVEAAGDFRVPDLEFGPKASATILVGWLTLTGAAGYALYPLMNSTWLAGIGCALVFLTFVYSGAAIAKLMEPFASKLPDSMSTAGELARTMAAMNYAKLARELPSDPSDAATNAERLADVHDAVFRIASGVIGVEPAFVRDNQDVRILDLIEANDGLRSGIS
jgi:hypothetical protein